jgi:hypothetical protein
MGTITDFARDHHLSIEVGTRDLGRFPENGPTNDVVDLAIKRTLRPNGCTLKHTPSQGYNFGLQDHEVVELCTILENTSTPVTAIFLEAANIKEDALRAVIGLIQNSETLQVLNVNHTGLREEGLLRLVGALKKSRSLNIRNNEVTERVAQAVLDLVKDNRQIVKLGVADFSSYPSDVKPERDTVLKIARQVELNAWELLPKEAFREKSFYEKFWDLFG